MADKASARESIGTGDFSLHCRGDVRLYCGQADCTPRSKKGRALLAILAAEQRPLSRVKIVDLLWSDRQEEQARASLRTLLADMKEQFNSRFDDLLVVERERVALGPGVRTDLTDPTLARPAGELFEGLDHIDPELDEWLRIEREKWARQLPAAATTLPRAQVPPAAVSRVRYRALAALLALLVAAVAVALLASRPWTKPETVYVAVLKFRDLTGRNALLAGGLAEQMRIELAQYPGIGVIAAQSSEAEALKGKDSRALAAVLGADYLLEGTLVPHEGEVQLSLRLMDRSADRPTWATTVGGTPTKALSGPEPVVPVIAMSISEVAADMAPSETMKADAAAWSALFKARSLVTNYEPGPNQQARELMLEVLSRHPRFVPALVTLAEATMGVADSSIIEGLMNRQAARNEAIRIARQAVALAPDYGPAYSALGWAYTDTEAAIDMDRRAVELSPGSGVAQHNWASSLVRLGDYEKAIRHRRIAARLDPMSWETHFYLAHDLGSAGRLPEARAALDSFLAKPVPAARKLQLVAAGELYWFGDWSRCLVFAQRALKADPTDVWTQALNMWCGLLLYGREAALPYAGDPDGLKAGIIGDDLDKTSGALQQLGVEFWRGGADREPLIHFLHRKGRDDLAIALYDQGIAAGIPADADEMLLPEMVVIMRRNERPRDGDRIAKAIVRRMTATKGITPPRASIQWAVNHALAGRTDAAIEALRHAHAHQWWVTSAIYDHPYNQLAFDGLRGDPRFRALVRDYDAWIARERVEAARELKSAGLRPFPPTPPPRARLS